MSDPDCTLWRLSPGFLFGVATFEADDDEPLEGVLMTRDKSLHADVQWTSVGGSDGRRSNAFKIVAISLPGVPDQLRPKSLELKRPGGESVLGPVDLATKELRKRDLRHALEPLGPRARTKVVDFVCSTAAARRSEGNLALSRNLFAVREALRERPREVAPGKGNAVAGTIDGLTALADRAFYIQGWVHDREAPITRLTAISPEGERVELLDGAFRFIRRDVDTSSRYFSDDPVVKPGFVAFFETQAPSYLSADWVVEVENGLGRVGEMLAPPVMQDATETARTILGTLPTQALPDEQLMADHVFPAINSLQERCRKLGNEVSVVHYGDRKSDPEISIIVPLYRRLDFLQHQLAQFVLDPEVWDAELIFVLDSPELDRDLRDLALQLFEVYRLPFSVATLRRSSGYAGANNVGVREARGRLLVLLNSDVLPDKPGWLGKMAAFYDSNPAIGVLGPKLLFEDDSLQHAGIYFWKPNYTALAGTWANVIYFKGLDRELPAANLTRPVPAVTGACMMIEKALYEQVGGFQEVYIQGDHEDTDLCLQMLEAGRQNWYIPQAELYHLEGQSYPHPVRLKMALYNRWLQTRRWGSLIEEVMDKYPAGNGHEPSMSAWEQ